MATNYYTITPNPPITHLNDGDHFVLIPHEDGEEEAFVEVLNCTGYRPVLRWRDVDRTLVVPGKDFLIKSVPTGLAYSAADDAFILEASSVNIMGFEWLLVGSDTTVGPGTARLIFVGAGLNTLDCHLTEARVESELLLHNSRGRDLIVHRNGVTLWDKGAAYIPDTIRIPAGGFLRMVALAENVYTIIRGEEGEQGIPGVGATFLYTTGPLVMQDGGTYAVDSRASAFELGLPSNEDRHVSCQVIDVGGACATNNVLIVSQNQLIDEQDLWYVLDLDWGETSFVSTGTDWAINPDALGAKGDEGAQGPTGPQGPAGNVGPEGPQGDPGEDGTDGADGADGSIIHSGIAPPSDTIGEDGDYFFDPDTGEFYGPKSGGVWPTPPASLVGPQGPQGIQGDKGDTGADGPIGPEGPQGVQGPVGPGIVMKGNATWAEVAAIVTPTQGDAWVLTDADPAAPPLGGSPAVIGDVVSWDDGNTAWGNIGPIQGPTGPTGPQGDPGLDGDDGAPGADGTDGVDGSQGPKGDKGDTGPAGADGLDGAVGPAGPEGPQGPQGIQGIQGDTGLTGAEGPKGNTGATGAQGPAGDDGLDGATGPKGDPGATGPQGPQGLPGEGVPTTAALYDTLWYNQFNWVATDQLQTNANAGNAGVVARDSFYVYQGGVLANDFVNADGSMYAGWTITSGALSGSGSADLFCNSSGQLYRGGPATAKFTWDDFYLLLDQLVLMGVITTSAEVAIKVAMPEPAVPPAPVSTPPDLVMPAWITD